MATTTQSTLGKPIETPIQEAVTLYGPDGSIWKGAPVDAREVLATGNYFTEKPEGNNATQQPVPDGSVASAETGEAIINEGYEAVKANENKRRQNK